MRIVLPLFFLVSGCAKSEEVDRRACEELRDHVVDLRINVAKGSGGPPVDFEPHRIALRQALGERYINTCLTTFTVAQLRCALEATSDTGAKTCLATTGG